VTATAAVGAIARVGLTTTPTAGTVTAGAAPEVQAAVLVEEAEEEAVEEAEAAARLSRALKRWRLSPPPTSPPAPLP
jgi:hypothetical protein